MQLELGYLDLCHNLTISFFLLSLADVVDYEESKSLFETNYSHVYFILYDTFIQAEANLKQKGNLNKHISQIKYFLFLFSIFILYTFCPNFVNLIFC